MIEKIVYRGQTFRADPPNLFRVPLGQFVQFLHDYQNPEWGNTPRNRHPRPETVKLGWYVDFAPLNRDWQYFQLNLMLRADGGVRSLDNVQFVEFPDFMHERKMWTNNHGTESGYRLWPTGENLFSPKGDIQVQNLTCGGNIARVIGNWGIFWKIETLDITKPPPAIDDVWGKWWLIQWATELDGRDSARLPDKTWKVGRFPNLKPAGTPFFLWGRGGSALVLKRRVRGIAPGTLYSPYNPPEA